MKLIFQKIITVGVLLWLGFILFLLSGCAAQKPVVLTPNISAIMPVQQVPSSKIQLSSVSRSTSSSVIQPQIQPLTLTVSDPSMIQDSSDLMDWQDVVSLGSDSLTILPTDPNRFFQAVMKTVTIPLSWDASKSPVDGYKIYSGPRSGFYTSMMDVGNVTSANVVVDAFATNYCAATSYSANGESDFSNEKAIRTQPPKLFLTR